MGESDKKKIKPKKPAGNFNPWHSVAVASNAGLTILTCIGICIWLGLKFDNYFGTYPYGLIVFSILGAASGLWSVIRKMLEK